MNCKYWIQEGGKRIHLLQGGGENDHWSSVPESPFLSPSKVAATIVVIATITMGKRWKIHYNSNPKKKQKKKGTK